MRRERIQVQRRGYGYINRHRGRYLQRLWTRPLAARAPRPPQPPLLGFFSMVPLTTNLSIRLGWDKVPQCLRRRK
ncbi:hypothetical protein BDW67DRAFT_167880 [Aspergillus spinulosporus]